MFSQSQPLQRPPHQVMSGHSECLSLTLQKPCRDDLRRGRDILLSLTRAGRLHANQDRTGWLDQAIEESEAGTDQAE